MSVVEELRVELPRTIGRLILREYDRETELIRTSVNPERHQGAADALRSALAMFAGAVSVFEPDDALLGPDWLAALRIWLVPHA